MATAVQLQPVANSHFPKSTHLRQVGRRKIVEHKASPCRYKFGQKTTLIVRR